MVITANNWGMRVTVNQREIKISCRVVQKGLWGGRNHTLEVGSFSLVGWPFSGAEAENPGLGFYWEAVAKADWESSFKCQPQEQKQCSVTPPDPLLSSQGSDHYSASLQGLLSLPNSLGCGALWSPVLHRACFFGLHHVLKISFDYLTWADVFHFQARVLWAPYLSVYSIWSNWIFSSTQRIWKLNSWFSSLPSSGRRRSASFWVFPWAASPFTQLPEVNAWASSSSSPNQASRLSVSLFGNSPLWSSLSNSPLCPKQEPPSVANLYDQLPWF